MCLKFRYFRYVFYFFVVCSLFFCLLCCLAFWNYSRKQTVVCWLTGMWCLWCCCERELERRWICRMMMRSNCFEIWLAKTKEGKDLAPSSCSLLTPQEKIRQSIMWHIIARSSIVEFGIHLGGVMLPKDSTNLFLARTTVIVPKYGNCLSKYGTFVSKYGMFVSKYVFWPIARSDAIEHTFIFHSFPHILWLLQDVDCFHDSHVVPWEWTGWGGQI